MIDNNNEVFNDEAQVMQFQVSEWLQFFFNGDGRDVTNRRRIEFHWRSESLSAPLFCQARRGSSAGGIGY